MSAAVAAQERQPVYWRFPGAQSTELRQAIVLERGDEDSHHLLLPDEVTAYLSGRQIPNKLGCVDDSTTCESVDEGILNALGFGARIVAKTSKQSGETTVTLEMRLIGGAKPETFVGKGKTIEAAAREAFAALRGQGTVTLTLTPPKASFRLDGRPYGQGSGDYIVPAGRHVLLVEAPGRRGVQQTIEVGVGDRIPVTIELPIADGRISLKTEPKKAKVFLDGKSWNDHEKLRDIKPGDHRLRVERTGFFTVDRTITIKPGTKHELSLKLKDKEPQWKKVLRKRHADVDNPWMVRLSLQFSSTRDGVINYETSGSRDLSRLGEAMPLNGFGMSIGWRSRIWEAMLLGFTYQSGSTSTPSTFDQNTPSRITEMSRLYVRALWGGARLSLWRIDGFATAGFGYVMEDFKGLTSGNTEFTAAGARAVLGTELGLRYAINGDWFAGLGGLFDYWPGERSTATLVISGGFSADVGAWFK